MQFPRVLALLGLLAVTADASSVTPVQKVIQLMEGMLTKGKEEKHAEQVQFAAYKQFCDDATTEKTRLIKEAEEKIEVLKADIEKNAANVDRLAKEMADLEEDIATQDADMKAATDVRKGEKATYDKTHKDYSESIDALGRAVQVLKKQSGDKAQAAASFLQLQSMTMMPEDTKRAIAAFMQDGEDLEEAAPEANGYEFQSSGVVEMLSKLEDKFVAELTTLEKEESGKRNVYELLMQDLTAQSEQAKSDVTSKTEQKAKNIEDKAAAESDLNDTSDAMAADKKYTADLSATCDQKATDFEARQQLRSEELEAINKAIEIIAGGAVSGNADKHLPSMLQTGAAFAQLRMTAESRSYERAAAFLSSRATELNSRVLMAIAQRAQADPFGKVRKMIQDLIVKLMEEANEESEHKGWCDTELSTNEKTRKEKTEAVETLHASIDQLSAQIAKLAEDITETSKEVSELDEKMAEATELRQKEKAKNAETISDAQAAETATAQAITVLKEFYSKAGDATAFVQQDPEAPEVFDTPYKGMGAESGGIVGMLEVIESDFARLESETKAAEESAQKEYDTFMGDSKVDKESKNKDIEHKTAKKQDSEQALTVAKKDLEGNQKELDASLAYYDKLKPSCVDAGVSYEDRVARRKEEIESLQESLKILNGEELA
jgi:hypothetical protein